MRTIIFFLTLLVVSFSVHAQRVCMTSNPITCDQGKAFAACMAAFNASMAEVQTPAVSAKTMCALSSGQGISSSYVCRVNRGNGVIDECSIPSDKRVYQLHYFWGMSCASRESLPAGLIIFSGEKNTTCADGCKFSRGTAENPVYDIEGHPMSIGGVSGWAPTGAVCGDVEPPPKQEPECVPVKSQTICIKPNGEKCLTASTGKTFCWGASDTGDKKDGNEYGTNGENAPKPPNPEPKPQDNSEWKPPRECVTINERAPGQYASSTRVVCSGTSTGNPNPQPCNPATDTNCRRPDEARGCDPKTDPKQCAGGSASGGHGCDAPPSCTGDPVGCAILAQSWRQRCSPNGNKVTGGSCNADGSMASLDCVGDQIMCRQTQAAVEERCRSEKSRNALTQDAGTGIDETDPIGEIFIPGDNGQGGLFNRNLINLGGGALFPSVSLAGQTFQPPPILYDVLAAIRWLVIAGCVVFAMRIRVGL